MKTFQQFQLDSQQFDEGYKLVATQAYKFLKKTPIVKKIGRLPFVKKAKMAVKNFGTKPTPTEYKIMYHGTTQKDANKIVRKGFRGRKGAGEGGLSDNINKKKSVYVTDDPQKGFKYAETKTKYDPNLSPSVIGVRVPKKNIERAYRDGEYAAPVKGMKDYVKDVKPIKIKNGKVMQEGKGDAIQAAKMLGKKVKQISPKLMAKTKEFLRNQRSGLSTSVRRSQKQLKAVEKTDKYSKLATDRKSIHPPTADAAQAKFTDRKVELIKNKNNRRRAKERILRRMFNMGEK